MKFTISPLLAIFNRASNCTPANSCTSKAGQTQLQLDDLDDDVLMLILDKLSLSDLLRNVRLVNRRWYHLQKYACRRRKSLTLLIGSKKWYKSIESSTPDLDELVNDDGVRAAGWWSNDALVRRCLKWPQYLPQLDAPTVHWLLAVFPNVSTLRVAQNGVTYDSAEHLMTLLKGWRVSLVTLKLMSFYRHESKRRRFGHFSSLLHCINTLPQLRHLSLDFFHRLDNSLRLQVLRQLHSFSFYSRDHADVVLELVQRHGAANGRLVSIAVRNSLSHFDVSFDSTLLAMDASLARRFTELRIESNLPIDKLRRLTQLFSSLKVLLLRVRGESMRDVFGALEGLSSITCLHLTIEYPKPMPDESKEMLMPVLPSVRGLSLMLKLFAHDDLEQLALHRVLPNVEVIGLCHHVIQCVPCGININRRLGSLWIKRMLCARRLVQPLKKCSSLKRLYTDQQMYWRLHGSRIQVVNRDVFEV
ncbi:hypothetical protein TYRP_022335 [Tyrophagus putrescentiae]|nr:hypothetical protein TYRP_022335 [Tyrophagus putrescentiae]